MAFTEKEGAFHWGTWVEVSKADHDWYADISEHQKSGVQRFLGRLANDVPGYGGTLGVEVEVQTREDGYRPFLYFRAGVSNALAQDQNQGVSNKRHHEILETVGFFSPDGDDV